MKTKIDIDPDFDYPDKERNLIKELCIAILIGAFVSIMALTAVCHADKIDHFFTKFVSFIVISSNEKRLALLLIVISFLIMVSSFSGTILLSRTRKGR